MARRLSVAPGRLVPLLMAASWLLAIHMVLLASSAPVERHLTIHAADWQGPPQRVVLLSDLHVSVPGNTPARLAQTVARIDAVHPDLVLVAGDFLSNGTFAVRSADVDEATAALASLHARLGVVAVLGNHDYNHGLDSRLRTRLPALGVTLIENDAVRRGPFVIVGLGDAYTGHAVADRALTAGRKIGGWPILLTHGPDAIPHLPNLGGLALAGHTHCGQISFPLIGPLYVPSSHKRYMCGVVQDGPRASVTTAGLGVSNLPIRLGAAPDYWVIDVGR
jgi:uncharacterized protein